MSFTEDDVANDFVDAIDQEVVSNIGRHDLRDYEYPEDENGQYNDWPFTVVRGGRRFEVAIDVRVVELPKATES